MRRENVNNMPATSRETETEAGIRDRQQKERGSATSHNIVSVISQLADDNLTLVRSISTGLAIAGVIVIARSIKLITKFRAASEIPTRFIEKNVSLCGKVRAITENGLQVEHIPIYLPLLSPLLSKHKDVCTSLREDDTLHCLVSQTRRSMWNYCLNEEVLRLGLARSAPLTGVLPDSPLYWHLHKRLHRAEAKAEKKGRGLWKEDGFWERASKAVGDNALIRLMRGSSKEPVNRKYKKVCCESSEINKN
ncbi:hypothetical protein Q5P01_010397 [Channa striata]|uniref:TNase-like domain-containing protein n=1 Tax=Channa striata TaxID=64152 RepID=A0AA88N1G0_CHASR|nr:hypothetical protein Q5P01_010397 [Channa striata]